MSKKEFPLMEGAIKFLVGIVLFMAMLFLPAGTLNWPEAWLFTALMFSLALIVALWLWKHNKAALMGRMRLKPTKGWDKAILAGFGLSFFAMFVVAGLDFRLGFSEVSPALKVPGFAGFVLSFALFFLAMRENSFALKTVEVRKGQKVVSTGPYSIVRHPMYSATLLMAPCIPLALGSLYALIPGALVIVLIIIRTYLEDKVLQKELEGYKEYARKTKYRLIPRIW